MLQIIAEALSPMMSTMQVILQRKEINNNTENNEVRLGIQSHSYSFLVNGINGHTPELFQVLICISNTGCSGNVACAYPH